MRIAAFVIIFVLGIAAGFGGSAFYRKNNVPPPAPEKKEPSEDPQKSFTAFNNLVKTLRDDIDKLRGPQPALWAALSTRLRFLMERVGSEKEWAAWKFDGLKRDLELIVKDREKIFQEKNILLPNREHLMGYWSDLDDSFQPYNIWIPETYDGKKSFPLVVLLHGQGMFNTMQCRASPVGQMLVAAPQGRGGMDYMYVGEADVLRVIDEVQTYLNVDPERIYLAGASMGGSGSWHLATHFPDRFAAIMPLCGNTDINVWAQLWLWRTPEDSPLAKVRNFLREDTCAVTYAGNMGSVSAIALQGEADPIVNQLHLRRMKDALQAAGNQKSAFHFLPYVQHGIGANYEMGLKGKMREPKPRRVHYKTAWLKYPGAYWVRIIGITNRLQHANIDAVADPDAGSITVKTTNVSEFEIVQAKLPLNGKPLKILIDGLILPAVDYETAPGVYPYVRGAGRGWQPAPVMTIEKYPPRKNANIEGPAEHAFMSRFVVVRPDEKDEKNQKDPKDEEPADREMLKAIKSAAQDFNDQWRTRFGVPCRMKKAAEITENDIRDSNLILYGDRTTNAMIEKLLAESTVAAQRDPKTGNMVQTMAGKLPLSFDDHGVKFNGKAYNGENLGFFFCYPNPMNPGRYVVIINGTTPKAYDGINVRFGNWFDWIPYDFRKHYDFAVFDDQTNGHHPETFLTWGFFGENWEYKPETTFEGNPAWRARSLPRVFPTIDLAAFNKEKKPVPETLYLDECAAKNVNVNKEYLERNRTLDGGELKLKGEVFKRGLCSRFPCSLTFECKGYGRLKLTAGVAWDGDSEVSDDRQQFEKVRVTVHVDGKQVFEKFDRTYKSEPLKIDVDLKNGSTVTLSANGGRDWLNGSFIWADARLEGKPEVKPPAATKAEKEE